MRGSGEKTDMRKLAMVRRKSPWEDSKGEVEAPPAEPEGEAADHDKPSESGAETGTAKAPPRNPWLPQADEPGEQRRSARIDDILRQRIGGGDGSGGFPGLPASGRARLVLPMIIAGSALALVLTTAIHVIDQGQSGIVTSFARYNRTLGPGTHMTLPWPIETVALHGGAKAGAIAWPAGESELLLTRDGQLIDLAFELRWKIKDARAFSGAFVDPEASLQRLALAEVRAGVAEVPFEELWNGARQDEVQQRVVGRIQQRLDALRSGIALDGLQITRANPPGKVQDAFKKFGEARAESDKLRRDTDDWAGRHIRGTQAEAAAFNRVYEQYRLAPEVVRSRMYYDTVERVLRNNDQKIVIGGGTGTATTSQAGGN